MKYDLTINQHNIKPHLDIERDIQTKKEGLLTFNLRVNQGNIEDYVTYRTVTVVEYRAVAFTTTGQPSAPRNTGEGSP
jgi:hypothetical protein